MADPQGRKWLLVLNNPIEKGFSHEAIKENLHTFQSLLYYCMSDEQGETFHTHVFFVSDSAIRFSTIKKKFPEAHIERAEGTAAENRDYVAKSGKWAGSAKEETAIPGSFEEWGELPIERQGERTDLARLYALIKDGLSNYEILEENPDYMLNLEKIERARQTVRERQFRDTFREIHTTYIWGGTGLGKTRGVMEQYGYSGIYRVTDYAHPFDGYQGESVLLLDEYNSSFKLRELLNYLDGYPLSLPARYSNKVACYTEVYLISNLSLNQQYPEEQYRDPATFAALLRRIHKVIHYTALNQFEKQEVYDAIRR